MKKIIMMVMLIMVILGCSQEGDNNFNYDLIKGTWYLKDINSITLIFETDTEGFMYYTDNTSNSFNYKIVDENIINLKYTNEGGNLVDNNLEFEISGTNLILSRNNVGSQTYQKISNFEIDYRIVGSWMKTFFLDYTLVGYKDYIFNEDGTGILTIEASGMEITIINFTYQTINDEIILFKEELENGGTRKYASCYGATYSNLRIGDYHNSYSGDVTYDKY